MAERDRFELDLAAALRSYLEDAPTQVRPTELARHFAVAHPHRRGVLARWSNGLTPAMAWALLVTGLLLALLVGSVLVGGRRPQLATVIAPPPTATPDPSALLADPAAVIAARMSAWYAGDTAATSLLYASDHTVVVVGDDTGVYVSDHFETRPAGLDDAYWEPRSTPFHGGPYWAQATVAGVARVGDPGRDVLAVYRFDRDNRIETEWLVVAEGTGPGTHEQRDAAVPPDDVVAFLDGCAGSYRDLDAAPYPTCYASDVKSQVSAGSRGGHWTEEWFSGAIEYTGITRTGDMVMIGNLVAYPFRGSADACAAGIDAFELDPSTGRILSHWAFCGPEASPASAVPAAAIPPELVGTWSGSSAKPETLVLGSCEFGEECGRFERFDDNGEHCVYPLEYRSSTGDEFKFLSVAANSFGCGWSPWYRTAVYVRLTPEGTVVVRNDYPVGGSFTLLRANGSPAPSASP
jgi:hypothetical protein